MRKFKDVDIISALRKIVDNNNLFYKTDFEYDVETLKTAAEGSHFYWMSRNSGTYLISERDAHIRNTYDYNTWQYYSDTKYYGVKAFAVEVTGNDGGKPTGDIYELNYKKHIEEVRRNSFNTRTVDVTFKPTRFERETTRTIDVVEYNDNFRAIINRYGEVKSVRHNLSREDEALLVEILGNFKMQREEEAIPANISAYAVEMVKERFHDYGYTRGDMMFTAPEDAFAALRHKIPVYILLPDNTTFEATSKKELDDAVYAGQLFGMGYRDKRLLDFYKTGNTLDDLPFNRDELKAIFFMALEKGKECIADEKERNAIDNIINVLDTALFSNDSRDAVELDYEHDEGMEQ